MNNEKNIEELIKIANEDIDKAACYELESDHSALAKSIYKRLFAFYEDNHFSGDVIFTWKSPSLVQDGFYVGRRGSKVENKIVIGNIFPNFISNKKYSLNYNRNGVYGSFPHDYFDIYLDHVAKYAYGKDRPNIKEYYPLKRAIVYEVNMGYFNKFYNFDDFLKENYLKDIWEQSEKEPFSNMNFDAFKAVSSELMKNRGIQMLNKLIGNST